MGINIFVKKRWGDIKRILFFNRASRNYFDGNPVGLNKLGTIDVRFYKISFSFNA
jgi:hypothetical protein